MLSGAAGVQEPSGWRISPERVNIQAGETRVLQILDDQAQELHGALWSIDQTSLAQVRELEGGRAEVEAKAAGTIHVRASLGGETRTVEIRIWPADQRFPRGTTHWGTHPIGRELGDLPAVPGPGVVSTFSLEQTTEGKTYLRGVTDDGIQEWAWLMPETTRDAVLICGDWLGGALVGADRADSFTLYVITNEGTLRWQRAFSGKRTAYAYNPEHLLHLVTEAVDGTSTVIGVDGTTGQGRFELPVPSSQSSLSGLRRTSTGYVCEAGNRRVPVRSAVSGLFVNIDGFAYVAFALSDWTLTSQCSNGSAAAPATIAISGTQRLLVWQIHPDGTHRETVVEQATAAGGVQTRVEVTEPTHAIIPDGLGGVLLSVRSAADAREVTPQKAAEFVYRVDSDGKLVYKLPLPAYTGPLKDGMVLGENHLGFATRGPVLIAFDVRNGTEAWKHDTHSLGIEVFAALADGSCLVQTPEALVDVFDAERERVAVRGQAMMGWDGKLYVKHKQ
jgi:outer membrane protein assembly factor BamB